MPRPRRRPSRTVESTPVSPVEPSSVPSEAGSAPVSAEAAVVGPTTPLPPVESELPAAAPEPAATATPEPALEPETADTGNAADSAPPPETEAPVEASLDPDPSPASEPTLAETAPIEADTILPLATEPAAAAETPAPPAEPRPLQLKLILESLLFAAQKALTPRELREFLVAAAQDETAPEAAPFRKVKEDDIGAALEELKAEHEAAGRTYRLLCVAGSWQFASVPEYAPWLRALLGRKARPPRLSQPGIETLTIIAYRQPVTRAEIEQIRGVNIDGVMQTLLERGLVVAVGRAEVIGRPVTYGTTPAFLEYFGIRALEDLPAADELRRIPVQRPEALLTVDPNLATAPADAPAPQAELPISHPADPAVAPSDPPPAATTH